MSKLRAIIFGFCIILMVGAAVYGTWFRPRKPKPILNGNGPTYTGVAAAEKNLVANESEKFPEVKQTLNVNVADLDKITTSFILNGATEVVAKRARYSDGSNGYDITYTAKMKVPEAFSNILKSSAAAGWKRTRVKVSSNFSYNSFTMDGQEARITISASDPQTINVEVLTREVKNG